jgi:hypothetical protein
MIVGGGTYHLLALPPCLPLRIKGLTLSTAKHDAIYQDLVRTSQNAVIAKFAEFIYSDVG